MYNCSGYKKPKGNVRFSTDEIESLASIWGD